MRAAVISKVATAPDVRTIPTPRPEAGQSLVRIDAAALQPVELFIASGRFYEGPPSVPYVPGVEAIGTVLEGERLKTGQRVRVEIVHPGYGINGCFAEYVVVDEADAINSEASRSHVEPLAIPIATELAAAAGSSGSTARLLVDRAVAERGPLVGKHVAILGATGAVGEILVQLCRLEAAGRIVAIGRNRDRLTRALSLGANAVVVLPDEIDVASLAQEITAAAEDRLDVVFDPLWGAPAAAALDAISVGGVLVNFGQSAEARAPLAGAPLRARRVTIVGHAGARATIEELRDSTRTILECVSDGRITMTYETIELEDIAEAWRRQASSPGAKLVITP